MAMFPFLIVVTALAGFFFGSKELADEAGRILLEAWPKEVAGPIALNVTGVLTNTRADVLTFGSLFALYFASSGVESLRIGLNRAYDVTDARPWWLLRLESIGYVLVAAVALLALGFLIVLGPLLFDTLLREATWLQMTGLHALDQRTFTLFRFVVASIALITALVVAHKWLAAGRRRMRSK